MRKAGIPYLVILLCPSFSSRCRDLLLIFRPCFSFFSCFFSWGFCGSPIGFFVISMFLLLLIWFPCSVDTGWRESIYPTDGESLDACLALGCSCLLCCSQATKTRDITAGLKVSWEHIKRVVCEARLYISVSSESEWVSEQSGNKLVDCPRANAQPICIHVDIIMLDGAHDLFEPDNDSVPRRTM